MNTFLDPALAVTPFAFVMAAGDREAFAFDADEDIASANASLSLAGGTTLTPTVGLLENTVVAGSVVTCTISGLTADADYELRVTFVRADGTRWTRALAIHCAG
jgi:hypothetical protein